MDEPKPFASNSSYPVRTTESIEYFVDGEAAFDSIAAAIEGAAKYVYITCAYASLDFLLRPPAGGQLLDLCGEAAGRGVKVALLLWLPDGHEDDTVPESEAQRIDAVGVLSRWDKARCNGIYAVAPQLGCHHQKTFVIDGTKAFVGGINAVQSYWDASSHISVDERRVDYLIVDPEERARRAADLRTLPLHDAFSSFTGPAVADVEANFVERWNGASAPHSKEQLLPSMAGADPEAGARIQVVRTIARDTYPHTAAGEESIREAMLNLIEGATENIYFENQYFFDDEVVAAIRAAGERRVEVVGLLCRRPDAGQAVGVLEGFLDADFESRLQWATFNPALRRYVRLYSPVTQDLPTKDIYVHAKLMVVDDRYVLLGSANIAFTSLDFHSEMCTLVDSPQKATALRRSLFAEHLCLKEAELPAGFGEGAELFELHADLNRQLVDAKKAPRSRVLRIAPVPVQTIALAPGA